MINYHMYVSLQVPVLQLYYIIALLIHTALPVLENKGRLNFKDYGNENGVTVTFLKYDLKPEVRVAIV